MKDLIFELEKKEKEWWNDTIKEFRSKLVDEPKHYAHQILFEKQIDKKYLSENIDDVLRSSREEVWQTYLKDEAVFHSEVLSHLIVNRDIPRNILSKIIDSEFFEFDYKSVSKKELLEKVARMVGEYTGRVMPYIYVLSLSTTQSRRARAGKTFEHIIETFMDVFGYPYKDQSALGTAFYRDHNLGKKVDLIVPGADEYLKNRSKCAIVTMKTTLRERWQEVAEELSRTNIPHIYLLTVDSSLTANVINTMKQYNITVVMYSSEKKKKFENLDNVQDFRAFFIDEMTHIINYWKKSE
ncbi:MAG: type II restriction endonuclease [Candidatus Saganbacteria bacterium]|nr:type II restriction endonuclease [Candidatus Saganbacteria bacterium]